MKLKNVQLYQLQDVYKIRFAELVKIDPKSIGVGQYQYDVSQAKLSESLDFVVSTCVNSVGVDLNTASVALLQRVSGLNAKTAKALLNIAKNMVASNLVKILMV